MRIKEVAAQASRLRINALDRVLKDRGIDHAIEYHQTSEEHFARDLDQLKTDTGYIFISEPFQLQVLKTSDELNLVVQSMGWSDGLFWQNRRWWPQCFLYQGLLSVMACQKIEVSLDGSVLVVGLGPAVRPTIAVAIGLGYRRIGIVETPSKKTEEIITFFQSRFFGVQMVVIPPEEVVSLPGMTSILFNTVKGSENESLLKYLYYFNFLRPGGLVVDLNLLDKESELLRNAELFGAKRVSGVDVFSVTDQIWLKNIFKISVDFSRLKSCWLESLSAA